ncbi:hypothetical protein OSB04_001282 [Centaurea solstitialis]|uniref:Acyl-coenzyme A thioesterase 13 n=1 Tax=Centaurea solstitialis TaxID=347529 RepID=A0AA38U196_9ASTR|nr:hypothetical protein OSB04_001282 [Centaurea solstitialis]
MAVDKTIEFIRSTQHDSDRVIGLSIPPQRPEAFHSFYEEFALKGIRVDRFQPGYDGNGNLAVGAIASLVDEVGATMVYEKDVPMNVSVDMSISYVSTAKLHDDLEISAKLLGGKGAYNGTLVVLKNKATGEIVAEGRHSLFSISNMLCWSSIRMDDPEKFSSGRQKQSHKQWADMDNIVSSRTLNISAFDGEIESSMEKTTTEFLQVSDQDSGRVSGLTVPTEFSPEAVHSFYEKFTLRGIQLDRFQPGFVSCSFTVPPRLTDRDGNLAVGAIANLVDEIGAIMAYDKDAITSVSVDVSISYLSTAKLNDELEISAKLLGRKGTYKGTLVVVKNKATGEMIAEGRHSNPLKELNLNLWFAVCGRERGNDDYRNGIVDGEEDERPSTTHRPRFRPSRPTHRHSPTTVLQFLRDVHDQRHKTRPIPTRSATFVAFAEFWVRSFFLPKSQDRNGNLAVGAIAGLIDVVGSVVVYKMDVNVSVDVSISYLSTAKLNDDLEINGKLLGRKGSYYGSLVVLMNKATGEMIAEGRHSFFSKTKSRI